MKVAIVNTAIGSWYPDGQERLRESIVAHHPGIHFFGFLEGQGEPSHKEYKWHSIQHALTAGYDIVFWMDASVWLVAPITPIIGYVQEHGIALWGSPPGFMLDQHIEVQEKAALGLDMHDISYIPYVAGGVMGFSKWNARAHAFLQIWKDHIERGTQKWGHDQPTLSYVTSFIGLPTITEKWWYYDRDRIPADACLLARGM